MAKKQKVRNKPIQAAKYSASNAILNYYLVLLFSVFPIIYTNQFSHIRHDKLYTFLFFSCIMVVVELIIMLFAINERKREGIVQKKWYEQLTFTDYAFGALILLYILSTVFSSFPADSFSGSQGRNNGLFLFIVYFLVYIVASRCFWFKEYVFIVLAATTMVVYALCVMNYFFIDPLNMFAGYSAEVTKDFTSTIGNKNIMSAYCCLTAPLFLVLFMNANKTVLRYIYLAVSAVGFAAMLCSDSESGFLGFIPALAIILIYYSRKPAKLRDFFIALSLMLISGKLVRLLAFLAGDKDKGFGSMQKLFIYSNFAFVLIAVAVAAAVGLAVLCRKNSDLVLPKAVPIALVCVFGAVLLAIVALFINFTLIDTESKLDSVMKFFRFNEKWGTHRGYMWIKSWEIFTTSGVKNALIGWGPDTYFSAFTPFFDELKTRFGDSSNNCAHNEFLNYLITSGVFGLAAYIALFASGIGRAFKAAAKAPLALAFIAPVVCYLIQSVVNIATPITTPLLFVFLGLAEGVVRNPERNSY